jgi:proteasome lid subunit RPN8/RPN11
MILKVKKDQLERIRADAKASRTETCGFIIGRIEGDRATAVELKRARNLLDSPVRFEIDPEEFLKVLRAAEDKGMEIIGFYHSHPSYPSPSAEDERFMFLWPDRIWLIISSVSGAVKAFIARSDGMEEIDIQEIVGD